MRKFWQLRQRRRKQPAGSPTRQFCFEPLEGRTLLTIAVTVDATNAAYQQSHPGTTTFANAVFQVNANGGGSITLDIANVQIEGSNNTINFACNVIGGGNSLSGTFGITGDNVIVSGLGVSSSLNISVTGQNAQVQNITGNGSVFVNVTGDSAHISSIALTTGSLFVTASGAEAQISQVSAPAGSASITGSDGSITNCSGVGFGVGIVSGSNNTVENNIGVIRISLGAGASDNMVLDNEVKNPNSLSVVDGISVGGDNNVVENNVIDKVTGTGIEVFGDSNEVSGNTVVDGGVLLGGELNIFTNNTVGLTLAGAAALSGGVSVLGHDLTVMSNTIVGGVGIGGYDNLILQNKINTDSTGMQRRFIGALGGVGVAITGTNHLIKENVIAGNNVANAAAIMTITGANTAFNLIEGNKIGVDATGNGKLGGTWYGILIQDAHDNTIGGDTTSERNIIGDNQIGIVVEASISSTNTTVQNRIAGNYIGVGANGHTDLGNNGSGISINQRVKRGSLAADTSILVIEQNVISGNGASGILTRGADLEIYENKIGTDATGAIAVPNSGNGISLSRQLVGESDNIAIGKIEGGNVISGNGGNGIGYSASASVASHSMNIKILGNKIGVSANGTVGLGNHSSGILLSGTGHQIGGGNSGEGNVVSGNGWRGIAISGPNSNNIKIQGNRVGTNEDGDAAIPNDGEGIALFSATNVRIGGDQGFEGNLIGGNAGSGIYVSSGGNHSILGNGIGVDVNIVSALPNKNGIEFVDSLTNLVGSTLVGNTISGNREAGVLIRGAASSQNIVIRNIIGLDDNASAVLANGTSGIVIRDGASNNVVGRDTSDDAGTSAKHNIIAGNAEYGVRISDNNSIGNVIGQNLIGITDDTAAVLQTAWAEIPLAVSQSLQSRGNGIGGIRVDGDGTFAKIRHNMIGGHQRADAALPGFGIGIFGTNPNSLGNNSVVENYVGINYDQTTDLGNRVGVLLDHASYINLNDNHIGNNRQANIWLRNGSTHNAIQANTIGATSSGGALFNTGSGIIIEDSSDNEVVPFLAFSSETNVIRHHHEYGILIKGSSARNKISEASIANNLGGGIELQGATANRPGRPEVVISHVLINSLNFEIEGKVVGSPNTTFTVEFFSTPATIVQDNGEGLTYVGSTQVTTNSAGLAVIDLNLPPVGIDSTDYISATATHSDHTTFDFSNEAHQGKSRLEIALELLAADANRLARTIKAFLRPFGLLRAASAKSTVPSAQAGAASSSQFAGLTVTFYNNGIKLGSAVTDDNGVATLPNTVLPFGTDNVVAVFEGDETYFGRVSEAVATVNAGGPMGFAAGQNGANADDEGRGVVVDSSGNSYVVGILKYADATSDSVSTKTGDIYLAKYDQFGTLVWQRTVGGSGDDRGLGIARDSSGNLYITGMFQGTVDFDPSSSTKNLTSRGGFDIFVASFTKNGTYRWARNYGNTSSSSSNADIGYGIAVSADGKVIVTGQFGGKVDFDASSSTLSLKSKGTSDIFVLRLTSGGNTSWAKQIGGTGADRGTAVTTDASNRVYVTGSFTGTVDFNPSSTTNNLASAGNKDAFLARFSSGGSYSYARKFGGTSNDEGHGVIVDPSNNVYLTGYFAGKADLDPGSSTRNVTSAGSNDAFIVKLNSSGNYSWGKRVGGSGDDRGRGITRRSNGDIAVIGNFSGTVDFDPGSSTQNRSSHGSDDAFVLRLSSGGSYKSAVAIGGAGPDRGRAIAVDEDDKLYALGQFFESLALETGEGPVNLTSSGGKDLFLVRLV